MSRAPGRPQRQSFVDHYQHGHFRCSPSVTVKAMHTLRSAKANVVASVVRGEEPPDFVNGVA
jgi:hypothetical protein